MPCCGSSKCIVASHGRGNARAGRRSVRGGVLGGRCILCTLRVRRMVVSCHLSTTMQIYISSWYSYRPTRREIVLVVHQCVIWDHLLRPRRHTLTVHSSRYSPQPHQRSRYRRAPLCIRWRGIWRRNFGEVVCLSISVWLFLWLVRFLSSFESSTLHIVTSFDTPLPKSLPHPFRRHTTCSIINSVNSTILVFTPGKGDLLSDDLRLGG